MDLSVIVPFSNALAFLRECGCSLKCQLERVQEVEVIFVDAGSSDGSLGLLQTEFSGFRIVRTAVRNPYVARNLAARAARGRTLVFTDADCSVGRDWLGGVRDAISQGADMVVGPVVPPACVHPVLKRAHDYENMRMERACRAGPAAIAYAYTNNFAVKADIFRALGGFVETGERGGDSEFVLRALGLESSKQMVYRHDMSVVHLEMLSLAQWWRKKFLYGRSATAAKLSPSAAALQSGGSEASVGLIFTLLIGRVCYGLGRLFARRPPPS